MTIVETIAKRVDSIIDQQEGVQLDVAYEFEDYRAKVNRYVNEYGNTLAVYKLAKLHHETEMQAFSSFISDQFLNQKQISFVKKIINHIELNGYIENAVQIAAS